MYPPVFATAVAASPVTALLGTNPTRLYLFGEAPQNVTKPYAVWQTVAGSPENYLGTSPNIDHWVVQVDVYADTASSARAVAQALHDAFEPKAYVTSWRGESRSTDTLLYRYGFDVEWWKPR